MEQISMDFFSVVELFTQFITYVMILSGIPPCYYMLRSGSTKGFPYPFFLANIVNACLAIGYGFLLDNRAIIQINTVAATFAGIYILSFLFVSKSKIRPVSLLLACCFVLGTIYIYLSKVVKPDQVMDHLGRFLLIVSTVLLSTPLLQVKLCIEEKNASDLSLSMLIAGTLCTTSWLTYGTLLKDANIYFPNIIGVSVNLCQIGALIFYGRHQKPATHKS